MTWSIDEHAGTPRAARALRTVRRARAGRADAVRRVDDARPGGPPRRARAASRRRPGLCCHSSPTTPSRSASDEAARPFAEHRRARSPGSAAVEPDALRADRRAHQQRRVLRPPRGRAAAPSRTGRRGSSTPSTPLRSHRPLTFGGSMLTRRAGVGIVVAPSGQAELPLSKGEPPSPSAGRSVSASSTCTAARTTPRSSCRAPPTPSPRSAPPPSASDTECRVVSADSRVGG